eukprot:GHVU01062095.1.p1 GENE.GHVU01062095.1~~GHVU01062095.1.p1  ORF type:complete len:153 (+),score=8.37 GHVU01062095.1:48-461(+)
MTKRTAQQADLDRRRVRIMPYPGREPLLEEGEADGRLGVENPNAGRFLAPVPDAHGVHPLHEAGIGLNVCDQLGELMRRIGQDAGDAVDGQAEVSVRWPAAPPSAGRSPRPRGATTASGARPTPSGSLWRGRWPHRP